MEFGCFPWESEVAVNAVVQYCYDDDDDDDDDHYYYVLVASTSQLVYRQRSLIFTNFTVLDTYSLIIHDHVDDTQYIRQRPFNYSK